MEPNNKQGGAASSKPVTDLEGGLHAMRLGDPSSPRLLPRHPDAATSSLPFHPQQVLAPTAAPVERPPPHVPQPPPRELAPTATAPGMRLLPHQHQSRPEARSYGGVEPSPADRIRRNLRYTAPAASTSSVAPKQSNLSVSAEPFYPTFMQWPSTPFSSTSQNENGSLDAYHPSALRSALHADAALLQWRREHVRARLLDRGTLDAFVLMSPEFSPHVVSLLEERDETMRRCVLAKVLPFVHTVMWTREGHDVFRELLRACEGRFDELESIVQAVCNRKGFLMCVAVQHLGVIALKELIRVVALNPQLRVTLLTGLLNDCLMERSKGDVLLHQYFRVLPHEDCKIITRVAVASIDAMLSSPMGCYCLLVCLWNATDGELQDLEDNILRRTGVTATNECGKDFLEHALAHGGEQLKVRIAERVGENIVDLSRHRLGHYVVSACIRLTRSVEAVECVLSAFLLLRPSELEALVRGPPSTSVLAALLETGKRYSPSLAEDLARRIVALPAQEEDAGLWLLMWTIDSLFHFH
ncbi:uncharacterized protein C2845_PM01G06030 [Panicum miliaceum]|uniref:PUM-HD domain-containing protein n=1 Tax=Panicum miliaceum TaxID=4540 RepID=A0A3L6TP51_PANMI|nr:uncharacterized protein C2845_PM01G06030 [Panicum miliaceum]